MVFGTLGAPGVLELFGCKKQRKARGKIERFDKGDAANPAWESVKTTGTLRPKKYFKSRSSAPALVC